LDLGGSKGWVVLELTPKSEDLSPGDLERALKGALRSQTAVVFLPVKVTVQNGVYTTHSLVGGYAFVRQDNHRASFYTRLSGTKYVESVLTRHVNTNRVLATVSGEEVRRLHTLVKLESDPSIREGDKVKIISGTYRDVDAEVMCDLPETHEVQVRVKMRSLDTLVVLPRGFLTLLSRGEEDTTVSFAIFDRLDESLSWVRTWLKGWRGAQSLPDPQLSVNSDAQNAKECMITTLAKVRTLRQEGAALWGYLSTTTLPAPPPPPPQLPLVQGWLTKLHKALDTMGKQIALFETPPQHLVLDGHYFAHRAHHALPDLRSAKGEPTGILVGFLKTLASYHREYPDHQITVVFDGKPVWRLALCPTYKANRPQREEGVRHTQIDTLKELLPLLGVRVCFNPEEEADDVIATLTREHDKRGESTLVFTSDQDLLQLCSVYTRVHLVNNKTTFSPDDVVKEYGVTPSMLPTLRALLGDTSDNLPGVERVATAFLTRVLLAHKGDLRSLYNSNFSGFTKIQHRKLLEAQDRVYLNEKLMPLRDVSYQTLSSEIDMPAVERLLAEYTIQPQIVKGW